MKLGSLARRPRRRVALGIGGTALATAGLTLALTVAGSAGGPTWEDAAELREPDEGVTQRAWHQSDP